MESDLSSDEELAQRAATDEQAFVELYRRYFPHVYDFSLRLSRDRDLAAMVTQASFFRVYQGLRASPPPGSFRVQLFAIARRDLVDRIRRHRGPVLEGEEPFVAADAALLANPALAPELPELARLVWQTARGFKPEEYELLDLQVRQEFEAHEIATIIGSRPETVQGRVVRTREALEESYTALLLLSRGRRECLDLDFLIGDEEWTPQLRRRVMEHLQACQACQSTRRRYPTAAEVLATITPVSAPPSWEDTILSRILQAVNTGETPVAAVAAGTMAPYPVASDDDGFGGWFRRTFSGGRGMFLAFAGGGLLVLAIALGALCSAGAFDDESAGDATPTPTASATASPSATPTFTATAVPTDTPEPTDVPEPTDTPEPTDIPEPTDTPVPPAPTATP